jgi:hypothetical protein
MRKFAVSCSAVLMTIPLLAACGGSSDKAAGDGVTLPSGIGSNAGSDGGSSDFSKLLADSNQQKFKITFTSGSDSDETTYAQDGKGNSSYSQGDSQTFQTSDGTVTCDTDSSGKAACHELAIAGAVTNPFFTYFNAGKTYINALGKFGKKSTKSIAGRKSTCITFSSKDVSGIAGAAIAAAIKGSASYCVDEDTGVLMEIAREDENGTKSTDFEVTKFDEPSDSDFTPPATPTTGPDISIPTSISLPDGITLPPGITIPGQ